ncbi:hypothetical protein HN832_00270 [archaeon]|nr:hypothetical protein [archaeon]MBT4373678.1 hypothetical protein [archaeon]MBT4531732.1 hypothetical protein [archaeon]MBT7001844.1 hypothetical protein [archaeon]MBT7281829.1 hypothetical protein [archaeon]
MVEKSYSEEYSSRIAGKLQKLESKIGKERVRSIVDVSKLYSRDLEVLNALVNYGLRNPELVEGGVEQFRDRKVVDYLGKLTTDNLPYKVAVQGLMDAHPYLAASLVDVLKKYSKPQILDVANWLKRLSRRAKERKNIEDIPGFMSDAISRLGDETVVNKLEDESGDSQKDKRRVVQITGIDPNEIGYVVPVKGSGRIPENEVSQLEHYSRVFMEGLRKSDPDCVFLCAASGVPMGWAVKSAWKAAYPGEKIPAFYTIDPKAPFRSDKILKDFFGKKIPQNARVVISDDQLGTSSGFARDMVNKYAKISGTKLDLLKLKEWVYPGYFYRLFDYKGLPGPVDEGKEVAPVVRFFGAHRKSARKVPFYGELSPGQLKKLEAEGKASLAGRRKPRGAEKGALTYIRTLKKIGQVAGEKLKREMEGGKSTFNLEKQLYSILAVGGILFGLIFGGFNLTGNVILGFSSRISSSISGISFLLGIFASFLWLMENKRGRYYKKY